MRRKNISWDKVAANIEKGLKKRLKEEATISRMSISEIVECSIKMYFLSIDKKRKK